MTGLWGGRFSRPPDLAFARFNESFSFDVRLLPYDVVASIAYARALKKVGIFTGEEFSRCENGLHTILKSCQESPVAIDAALANGVEDVHSFVEAELGKLAGDLAKKLHTGRSRNDQVATDTRLYVRDEIDGLLGLLLELQSCMVELADKNLDVIMPGYTHLQRAQPVLFSHYMLSFFEMLSRDRSRLVDARRRVNVMPLGSGALAGNSWKIDRVALAKELGFAEISRNSLDATSDRDFVLELHFVAAQLVLHLSRMAEDFIIYSSAEFGFIELGDEVTTGSSLMPQKKNPDALELIRGKSGRFVGNLTALLVTLKGLPSAYNKDLQEDKEGLFDTVDQLKDVLLVMKTVLSTLTVKPTVMRTAAETGFLNATELADALVRSGTPFREAHHIVGKLVQAALQHNSELGELDLRVVRELAPQLSDKFQESLSLAATLNSKDVPGGTAPKRVEEALKAAREQLAQANL